MVWLRIFAFIALITIVSATTLDLNLILKQSPQCAQICTINVLSKVNCSLLEMRTCVCPNTEIQLEIATCVIGSCNQTEELATTSLFQSHVCNGIAQESRATDIPVTLIIVNSIAYPVLALRLISRWWIAKRLWWDDWIILGAALSLIPQTVLLFIHADQGFGRHFWDIPVDRVAPLRQMFYGTQLIYCVAQVLAKISILCLYLRIFVNQNFRRAVWGTIAFLGVHGIIYFFCILFQCVPISAIWTMAPAKCLNLKAIVYSAAGFSIFEDFVIMFLPVWELRKLKLSSRKKIALMFMFALGSFASITSIIRLRYITKFSNSVDVSWDNTDTIIWSVLENFSAVICSCVLCIRPLIIRILPKFLCNNETGISSNTPGSNQPAKLSTKLSVPFNTPLGYPHNGGHFKLSEGVSSMSALNSPTSILKSEKSHASSTIKIWINKEVPEGGKVGIPLHDIRSP